MQSALLDQIRISFGSFHKRSAADNVLCQLQRHRQDLPQAVHQSCKLLRQSILHAPAATLPA